MNQRRYTLKANGDLSVTIPTGMIGMPSKPIALTIEFQRWLHAHNIASWQFSPGSFSASSDMEAFVFASRQTILSDRSQFIQQTENTATHNFNKIIARNKAAKRWILDLMLRREQEVARCLAEEARQDSRQEARKIETQTVWDRAFERIAEDQGMLNTRIKA